MNKKSGFTLVEFLIVIGILAILTAVVLVTVNPGRQMAQAHDIQRRADVNTILAAITAWLADPANDNQLSNLGIVTLCSAGVHNIGTDDLDLAAKLVPSYLADIPIDPSGGTPLDTGYDVCIADVSANRVTVSAPNTELAATTISVTR